MSKIFVTSDLHFCHDRAFIYGPRGFETVAEHNETIVSNWNKVVSPEDDVYVIGDLMLNDNVEGIKCLEKLNGKLHIIYGNHDTDTRKALYAAAANVVEICGWATMIHYHKYHFYLSHFPTLTGNLEAESLHQCTLNLFGHTHSRDKFYEDRPYMYNIALDAHNNIPVLLDDIIEEMKEKVKECISML